MSRSDEVISSISWTEIGKSGEEVGDSYTPTFESGNIDLSLSLGGLYGENVSKDMKGKNISLGGLNGENVSKDMKGKNKMYPERPENWAVESAFANAALGRAMNMLKSNPFPLTPVPLTIQDPSPMITAENNFKNTIKKVEVNQIQNLDLMTMMPSVSTIGDGLYRRKIEGFLFSCSDEKNINIVCLCHGKIMSPARFIKHAGGIERENPLEYIDVTITLSTK